MTLDEFLTAHSGKFLDYDGMYPGECVDLIKYYNKQVIGAPQWMGDPKTYIRNPAPAYYEYKENRLLYIPPRGAIAIWNGNVGHGRGHVAIVLTAGIIGFDSIDQNWPKGSAVTQVHHTYNNVLGYLIPRPQDATKIYNMLLDDLRAIVNKYPKI